MTYRKKYYDSHKEQIAVANKKYNDDHKEETSERSKKYYIKNREEILEQTYKRTYGEPMENKMARLEAQGYKCANQACLKPINMTTGHQDHNHNTGEMRGVLCKLCNKGLGLLQDSADIAQGIANYRKLFS